MTMPTMEEIAAKEQTLFEILGKQWSESLAPIFAAAQRGVESDSEIAQIRDALTGDDYASLPSDLPTVRMAHTIRADHDKFRNQVRDTCARAERAEATVKERDADIAKWHEAKEGWEKLIGSQYSELVELRAALADALRERNAAVAKEREEIAQTLSNWAEEADTYEVKGVLQSAVTFIRARADQPEGGKS